MAKFMALSRISASWWMGQPRSQSFVHPQPLGEGLERASVAFPKAVLLGVLLLVVVRIDSLMPRVARPRPPC